jgi:hypothetical protein
MTAHHLFRHPTVDAAVPTLHRPTHHVSRWAAPVALVVLSAAAVVTIDRLGSDDAPTSTGTGSAAVGVGVEPLIVPEEQAFIDGRVGPVVSSGSATAGSAAVGVGVEPLIVPEEQAFIDGEGVVAALDWCALHDPC